MNTVLKKTRLTFIEGEKIMNTKSNKLSFSQFIQISIMLFGLFFGAGNLIFPPLLGYYAGKNTFVALIGFTITAVIFPILGAIVVGKTAGLNNLAKRISPSFAIFLTCIIYLAIGPGLGIPRAGSVPFELAILPYLPNGSNILLIRLIYTFIFFLVAYLISLNPSKLVTRIGKYLSPMLLLLILFMFWRLIFLPLNISLPQNTYQSSPLMQGFVDGYMTMDAVAALNFGYVIALSLKRFNLHQQQVTSYTTYAGLLAGAVLLIVYLMLSILGSFSFSLISSPNNGAEILAVLVKAGFGNGGLILLALVFTLACLTTCVGLITSCGEYFTMLFKERISYKNWVLLLSTFSFVVANFGLNKILAFSYPILIIIYPLALTLIILGISHEKIKYTHLTYLLASVVTIVIPLVHVLSTNFNLNLPFLTSLEAKLPLSAEGLSFILPTIITSLLAQIVSKLLSKINNK